MLWGPLALSHCLGLPVLEQRVLAPESAFEGCQPVETSSSPSLWTAVQAQCQGAGVIQGVPDAGAQKGRKSDGCRPWPVDGVDIFSTMFSMPWIPVWPFRSHKSLGQRRCTSSSRQHAPRAPRPRRPAPRGSLETPPAPVARVTSRLPTSKPLRARPRGNCSFSLRSGVLKRAWRAGAAGSRRRTTAPLSGSRSLQGPSVQLQSPEDFRSPEGREAGRRVLCSLQPASLALHPARPVSPFSQPRPPSPSARGTFAVPLHRAGVYYPEPASLGRGGQTGAVR